MSSNTPDEPTATGHHYDGGDGEPELIEAAKKLLVDSRYDAIAKIRNVYWPIGNILEIAVARGYTRQLTMRGWIAVKLKCSGTHGYDCYRAWRERREFEEALKWFESGNSGWLPNKASGPPFAIELVRAWKDRGKTNGEKLAAATRNNAGQSAKKLIKQIGDWKQRFQRLRAEHLKLAAYAGREPLVCNRSSKRSPPRKPAPSPSIPESTRIYSPRTMLRLLRAARFPILSPFRRTTQLMLMLMLILIRRSHIPSRTETAVIRQMICST